MHAAKNREEIRAARRSSLAVLVGLSALGLTLAPALAAAQAHAVPAANAARVSLRGLQLRDRPGGATLILALSSPVRPHVFRLSHPNRLVIDLPGTRRHAPLPPARAGGLVTAVRSGVPGHALRLVLTLSTRSVYRWQWLPPQGRSAAQLRIDVGRVALSSEAGSSPADAGAAEPSGPIRAAHAPAGERQVIVAVDPGHGGVDPGATGPDGLHEKDVTLAIGRALAARIDATPGMRALLTRDGDYFVPLRARMDQARAAHADLFVSIHADSVGDPLVAGASVYILSERGASSEAARQLADEENAADLKGGISLAAQAPDLRSVLLNLSQDASIGQSGEAAEDVLRALDGVGPLRRSDVQHAAFVVLKSPDVPSMLVESAYISNRADERRLRSPAQQHRLAEAIFAGIAAYFRQYPPQGSLFARTHAVASSPSS